MIKYYLKRIKDKKIIETKKFVRGSLIDIYNPTNEELELISKQFSLNLEMLKDGLDDDEIPRIDDDDKNSYIYVKSISKRNELITLLLVVTDDFVIGLSKEETKLKELILNGKTKINTTQKKKLLINILSSNNEILEKSVEYEVKKVNTTKNKSENLKEKDLEELLRHEEYLNKLASAYNYMLHVYSKMIKKIRFYDEDEDLIEDLIVESEEGLNICTNSMKTISNIRNHYTLILSNKLNQTIKILTIFTIVLSITTAISGIYGMNIKLPFQENHYAILFVFGFMLILTILFLYLLRKREVL